MKRVMARVALVMFGSLIAFALAEVSVRFFYPNARDGVVPGRLFIIDDDLGWRLSPSKKATHRSRYFDAEYTTNSFGFRDRPRAASKATGKYRILLYGDSLVFGWGVQNRDRFSDLIEEKREDLEIWNHAVPGYGLDQEIISYEREGESLNADEVMVFVDVSTLSRITTGFIYAKYKPRFVQQAADRVMLVPVPQRRNAVISLSYELFSPFYLPYFLQSRIATLQEIARSGNAPKNPDGRAEAPRWVTELSKATLTMAHNTARRRNHRMTILVANVSEPDRHELRGFCKDVHVSCLEISSEISARNADGEMVFGQYDTHWNAKANGLIADRLLEQIGR